MAWGTVNNPHSNLGAKNAELSSFTNYFSVAPAKVRKGNSKMQSMVSTESQQGKLLTMTPTRRESPLDYPDHISSQIYSLCGLHVLAAV